MPWQIIVTLVVITAVILLPIAVVWFLSGMEACQAIRTLLRGKSDSCEDV